MKKVSMIFTVVGLLLISAAQASASHPMKSQTAKLVRSQLWYNGPEAHQSVDELLKIASAKIPTEIKVEQNNQKQVELPEEITRPMHSVLKKHAPQL
ncbi:MAG: hypothetical protein ACPGJV_10315 [Bacteriovoracaceae bacterium]